MEDGRVLVWISAWTILYKVLVKRGGLSPWRAHVWISFIHALLVSLCSLPHAVSISCFADPETLLFHPPPMPWLLDAALGYYTFDTIRALDLLMKSPMRTSPSSTMSLGDRAVWLSESSPLLVPTTFPFSLTLSISLSAVVMSNLYRNAAFALLAEELSTVFLRAVQILPSRHPIQLCCALLFLVFFIVMRVVVGLVLISRSFEVMAFFSWATVGERTIHFYLGLMLLVSRLVHFLWLMAMLLALGQGQG
jgi:hypothetical protein